MKTKIKVGDWVKALDGEVGYVVAISRQFILVKWKGGGAEYAHATNVAKTADPMNN